MALPVADRPETGGVRKFAEDYHETGVDLGAVRHVYALRPLGRERVHALNGTASLASAAEDAAVIGHPAGTDMPRAEAR
ncbi:MULTISPECIES: hypothetical protein [Streptomyces]|uniref:hypothetical protein n=1 Tax=Streptomyces TaxID=1883 RepID=UPI002E11BC7F